MQKDARNPTKSQAEIHKISSVEPFSIVYAAILVRFQVFFFKFLITIVLVLSCQTRQALSSTAWGPKDLHFDYKLFTKQLLGLFKDEDNPWVKNLLNWWNEYVTVVVFFRQFAQHFH